MNVEMNSSNQRTSNNSNHSNSLSSPSDKINARQRILDSAAKIFAQKSFDGARVDEIAKDAGVPKSLIYYHFKSKDEILTVLIHDFLEDYAQIVNHYREESNRENASQLKGRMQNVYYQFGKDHEDLVRTIIMDSAKRGNQNTALFQMIQLLLPEHLTMTDFTDQDKVHLMNEFFFNVIPCIAYIIFRDSWIPFFQMQPEQFDEAFLKMYTETHIAYHKKIKEE